MYCIILTINLTILIHFVGACPHMWIRCFYSGLPLKRNVHMHSTMVEVSYLLCFFILKVLDIQNALLASILSCGFCKVSFVYPYSHEFCCNTPNRNRGSFSIQPMNAPAKTNGNCSTALAPNHAHHGEHDPCSHTRCHKPQLTPGSSFATRHRPQETGSIRLAVKRWGWLCRLSFCADGV